MQISGLSNPRRMSKKGIAHCLYFLSCVQGDRGLLGPKGERVRTFQIVTFWGRRVKGFQDFIVTSEQMDSYLNMSLILQGRGIKGEKYLYVFSNIWGLSVFIGFVSLHAGEHSPPSVEHGKDPRGRGANAFHQRGL